MFQTFQLTLKPFFKLLLEVFPKLVKFVGDLLY